MNNYLKTALSLAVATAAFVTTHSATAADIKIEPSPSGEVSIVVDFEVKPGKEAEFERVFQRSTICSRLEPGNITFNINKVMDASGHYVLYEQWRSVDALNSHFARPYTKALFEMFDRNLVRPVTDGGLRFVTDMYASPRSAPATTHPSAIAECR